MTKNESESLRLTPSEMQIIYKLVKKYEEHTPNNDEEDDNSYDGEYETSIDKKQIRSILNKIRNSMPNEAKDEIDKEFLRKKYHSYNNDIDSRVYTTLKKAFEHSKTVEIEYFNMESAEFKKRKLDVYYTSAKYTIGYCHLRKEIRKFRTSRISSAKIINSKYKIPKSFDKNDY